MKSKRLTEEQIAFYLRQAESGTAVAEVCRKLQVSEAIFSQCTSRHNFNRLRILRGGTKRFVREVL